MKSLNERMPEYNSWVLHCTLKHKFTEELWRPLGLRVKDQLITIAVYVCDKDGNPDFNRIVRTKQLHIEDIYKEFEIL